MLSDKQSSNNYKQEDDAKTNIKKMTLPDTNMTCTYTILKQIKGCLWLTCGLIILPVYSKSVKKWT